MLVIWSLPELPLSLASDTLGALGAVVSSVMSSDVEFPLTLPAASVWNARM